MAKIPPGELQPAQVLVKHSYETENIRIEPGPGAGAAWAGSSKFQAPSSREVFKGQSSNGSSVEFAMRSAEYGNAEQNGARVVHVLEKAIPARLCTLLRPETAAVGGGPTASGRVKPTEVTQARGI